MSKKVKMILMISAAVLIVALTVTMVVILVRGSSRRDVLPVYRSVTVEAGEPFNPSIFLKSGDLSVSIDESSVYDTSKVGDYTLKLHLSNGSEAEVTLQVRDTQPPVVRKMPPLLVKRGSAPLPEDILPRDCVDDATSVKVTMLSDISSILREEGAAVISLRVEDEGGNTVKADVPCYVTDALNGGYRYEIGSPVPDEETLLPGCGAHFQSGQTQSVSAPGKVTVYVTVFGGEYILRYEAVDTVPPKATAKTEMRFKVGESLPEDPSVFLSSLEDATTVTVRYAEEYVFDRAEQKTILLILTDLGGNSMTLSVTVFVYEEDGTEDTVPPVISGVRDLTVELGSTPDYLDGISVYDGRDGVIPSEKIIVDVSKVKLNELNDTEGYPITYTVYDAAGNKAVAEARVRVVRPAVSEEELEACFDGVLRAIPYEGMSRFTVLSNVYDYLTARYELRDEKANTDGGDYRVEAYWGFKLEKGNFETCCAMLQVLLDKLDIEYIRVNRQRTGSVAHSWLLVDYGIGWLYMDCTPIDGYVWTKDGRILAVGSAEEKALSKTAVMERKAMTDADLKQFTDLANSVVPGWNYYKADVSEGTFPPTAVKTAQGGYLQSQYTVTYAALSGGTLSGQTVQTVAHGQTSAAVTALPKPGYKFVMWDDGYTGATRTDTVKRSFTARAVFELDNGTVSYYDVTYNTDGNGMIRQGSGTLRESVEQKNILYGRNTVEVTALPNPGFYFIRWSDGNTNPTRSDVVRGNATYTAVFGKLTLLTYMAGTGGRIEGNAHQSVIPGTWGDYVRAVPEKGYVFKEWSDGVPTAECRDTDVSDLTVTAYFEKDTSVYVIRYVAGTGGRIEGKPEQYLICGDSGSTVEAIPDVGFVFVSWSDGSTDAKRRDVVYENQTLTASFRPLEHYTLLYVAGDGGSIEGVVSQTVTEGQSGSAVTAKAAQGYRFVSWDDGERSATRTDTPTADMTVSAIFEKEEQVDPPDPPDPSVDPSVDPSLDSSEDSSGENPSGDAPDDPFEEPDNGVDENSDENPNEATGEPKGSPVELSGFSASRELSIRKEER